MPNPRGINQYTSGGGAASGKKPPRAAWAKKQATPRNLSSAAGNRSDQGFKRLTPAQHAKAYAKLQAKNKKR